MGPIAWYLSYNWTWFSYSLLSRVGSLQHHVSAVGVCWRWLHFPDTSVSIFFLSFMIINCFLFFFHAALQWLLNFLALYLLKHIWVLCDWKWNNLLTNERMLLGSIRENMHELFEVPHWSICVLLCILL